MKEPDQRFPLVLAHKMVAMAGVKLVPHSIPAKFYEYLWASQYWLWSATGNLRI